MITHIYGICLLISVGFFIYMAQKNYHTMDAYFWSIMLLCPIVIMGYWLKSQAETTEAVAVLFCFIYLESTILVMVLLFAMLRSMGIPVQAWMKIAGYGAAAVHMAIVCLSVHSGMYYQSIEIIPTAMGNATKMTDGPMKPFHYVFLGAVFIWLMVMLILGIRRNGTYSRRSLIYFGSALGIGLLTHLLEGIADSDFTILPALYVVGELIIVLDYDYTHAHDISCVLADLQEESRSRGYVAVSRNRTFLGCNDMAKSFLGFLKEQRVDEKITEGDEYKLQVLRLIDAFEENGTGSSRFQLGEMTCACEISPLTTRNGKRSIGYLLDLRDATEEQRNYDIIKRYNESLNEEIQEKTRNIRDIQRKVVLGMADIIENRDSNTGGHVKRTSDIIHIIVDEINRQGHLALGEELSQDIVRAAPTHDLGKITIDSTILNKPGRLDAKEFEIMKTHSAKSGEMVRILLEGVEEARFVQVAYNVARFHHERWDGRGYPEGLVGTMIPLEARIMAVADVYDALVSKRCYKGTHEL